LNKIQKIIRTTVPILELPSQVRIEETEFEESQAMLREMDEQRKKEDPDFRGAFHEKSEKNQKFIKLREAQAKAKEKAKEKAPKIKPKSNAKKPQSKGNFKKKY
jgi:ATP-dependent RNA helicase RhlE